VIVHSAGIQDRDGAALVFDKIRQRFNWLELVWADNGYNAWQVNNAIAANPGLRIEIVKRSDDMKGFVVLPRRWVVERTFSWFGRNRRLNKDYENLADTLLAFVIPTPPDYFISHDAATSGTYPSGVGRRAPICRCPSA
jgi:putative transposase